MFQLTHLRHNLKTLLTDMGHGVLTVTHSGLAMVGLLVTVAVLVLSLRPDYLAEGEAIFTTGCASAMSVCGGCLRTWSSA